MLTQSAPLALITPQRFDLLAKVIYARFHVLGLETKYHEQLYRVHIKVFNNGVEHDNGKKTVDDFVRAFDATIASMQQHGFKDEFAVPVGNDNVCINGAHRISTCVVLGVPVKLVRHAKRADVYDANWFLRRKKFLTTGLPRSYADRMALEYCRLHASHVRIIVAYPRADPAHDPKLRQMLAAAGHIEYETQFRVTGDGLCNLIKELYHSEAWLGSNANGWSGAHSKERQCKGAHPVRVFVFHAKDASNAAMVALKQKLRGIWKIEKSSLHINDTAAETRRIASALLNANSQHYLNHAPAKLSKVNADLLTMLLGATAKLSAEQRESIAVDSSLVMGMYGLRDARDVDFIPSTVTSPETLAALKAAHSIDCHAAEFTKYCASPTLDDVIYTPTHHFYVHGVKFITPQLLKMFKEKRAERPKDANDLVLLKKLL